MLFKLTTPKFWYKKNIISYILLPFSFIYFVIISLRKLCYRFVAKKKFSAPIIVVGNITVGGTGKTPLVIYLAELLKDKGYSPGIVSRGYGGKTKNHPLFVTAESKAEEVGDEALLIASRTKCPVVIDPKRVRAVSTLLLKKKCAVVISDDGLQHYALSRDIEIAVVDSELGLGNGFLLPAGPLRESPSRLKEVDFVVKNYNMDLSGDEFGMVLKPIAFYNLKTPGITKKTDEFRNQTVHAFAGIGNPNKFFKALRKLGVNVIEHPFPDHHVFQQSDFSYKDEVVIMTEKDSVKCGELGNENCWFLKVNAEVGGGFAHQLLDILKKDTNI